MGYRTILKLTATWTVCVAILSGCGGSTGESQQALHPVAAPSRMLQALAETTSSSANLLTNPGFESGGDGWSINIGFLSTSGVIKNNASSAHSGSYYAELAGSGLDVQSAKQQVTIPSGSGTPYLQFWYNVTSSQSTGSSGSLTVAVRPTSSLDQKALDTISSLTLTSGWVLSKKYDLSAYAGQKVEITFTGSVPLGNGPVFRLDDVVVATETGSTSTSGGTSTTPADGSTFNGSVAELSGARSEYVIKQFANGYTVIHTSGKVTAVPASAVAIKFSDLTVNLGVGKKALTLAQSDLQTLIELYVAYFNRIPDADGLSYWIDQRSAGKSFEQIGSAFYGAAVQYASLTGYSATMSNADFVNKVYRNVLGRDQADADGLKYWTNALATGAETRGTLVQSILSATHKFKGDKTYGWVADLLDNKVSLANLFSVQQGLNYNSPETSITKTMALVAAVTSTGTSSATALLGKLDSNFSTTGASGDTTSGATLITGIAATFGPVVNGTVTPYTIVNETVGSAITAGVKTDAAGAFSLNLGNYTGMVLLKLTGGAYVDPVTRENRTWTGELISALPHVSGPTTMNVTPLTHAVMIPQLPSYTAASINDGLTMGVNAAGFDVVTTRPANVLAAVDLATPPASNVYAEYLGMFSQYAKDRMLAVATAPGQVSQYFRTAMREKLWPVPKGYLTEFYRAANAFANSGNNVIGLPTVAPMRFDPLVDSSQVNKTWSEIWNGAWTCPATSTRVIDLSRRIYKTFQVTLKEGMWCVEEGARTPSKAKVALTLNSNVQSIGDLYCDEGTLMYPGWCVDYTGAATDPTAFLATYTPLDATATADNLGCRPFPQYPDRFSFFRHGGWCLPPGADLPTPSKNNQCAVGQGQFADGWCYFRNPSVPTYVPKKAVDLTVPEPFDAGDPLRYTYVSFSYACPADSYHPTARTTTGSAFGAPLAPYNETSPCLESSKNLERTYCGTGTADSNLLTARAEQSYYNCLANNSSEPYKSDYQARALQASDRIDFFKNACPYPQVRRNGLCIDPSTQPATNSGANDSAKACLTSYTGPDDDPQTDSYCKLAAFDICLHKATGQTTYDHEGRTACNLLRGLLEATGTKTYKCSYCPYPY